MSLHVYACRNLLRLTSADILFERRVSARKFKTTVVDANDDE